MFHADRGPLEGLLIQIFQAGKVAPREEVRFYGPEAAFLAGFAVGMPLFMADESEAVRGGEGGHLRHDHRIPPGAPQTGQVRVIDHTDPPGIAPEQDRKSTRLNSSHGYISYAVFCLKKKTYSL